MQININDDITKKIEERVQGSNEFTSVEAYVNYVLEEVIKQTGGDSGKGSGNDSGYNKAQEEEVKNRLESLGYLD